MLSQNLKEGSKNTVDAQNEVKTQLAELITIAKSNLEIMKVLQIEAQDYSSSRGNIFSNMFKR
jgi:hypothetical protein